MPPNLGCTRTIQANMTRRAAPSSISYDSRKCHRCPKRDTGNRNSYKKSGTRRVPDITSPRRCRRVSRGQLCSFEFRFILAKPRFWLKTQIPDGSKRTFDSPRPVVAEIRNVLNCQNGSENGSVATWLWFNFLGPIARYRLGAQAQALETGFQSLPARFFWHDCQITQPVVVS